MAEPGDTADSLEEESTPDPRALWPAGGTGALAGSWSQEIAVEMGKIQVLLAEKRTSLSAIRTGLAIFTLPLSVTMVLITTSRFYQFKENLHYLIPLLVLCAALVLFGTYLIVSSLLRFRHQAEQIKKIKAKSPTWREILD